MATSKQTARNSNATSSSDDQPLKLALAISLLRSKLLQRQQPSFSESDALRWKRKAKERKQLIVRLREELKEAEDASRCDLFPEGASCKCFFFDNLGVLNSVDSDHRFNDVFRRRFLRQVRLKDGKRSDSSNRQLRVSDLHSDYEAEQLRASIDFLVDLCDNVSPVQQPKFANWAHQAVDFILASLRSLLSTGNNLDFIEGIITSLIMRLVRRMCSPSQRDGAPVDTDSQFYVQHLLRKLGSDAYIGQHTLLSVSQRIYVASENLLFMDPFDDSFPNIHRCLYIMIQLIEFLVSDYLLPWSKDDAFDNVLFEECVISLLHARKGLALLESRNGLYMLYMDRVIGLLCKQVCQVPSFQKLNQDILDKLFC